jgi:DNA polymerase
MGDTQHNDAWALLSWQVELGAEDAILDAPINRFDLPPEQAKSQAKPQAKAKPAAASPPPIEQALDTTLAAQQAANGAADLPSLRSALAQFPHCALKDSARQLVFADGNPKARVMIIGEAPGRDEDIKGKPFVGRAGQLLDRMFAAIGLSRDADDAAHAIYITNMLPWRPPQNRDPTAQELAMLAPFVRRHIELANPDMIVLMGNHACQGLIGKRGITRLHGNWAEVMEKPALPMFHPAYLLRRPGEKAKAWDDLLSLKAKLKDA